MDRIVAGYFPVVSDFSVDGIGAGVDSKTPMDTLAITDEPRRESPSHNM
jgi:hypothetical protein